jgi:predicted phosphodiesterase
MEKVLLTHSHPFEEDGYLYGEDFEEVYEEIDADYMFVGHTHEQAVRRFEDGFVVNPGSVGMPKKGFDDGRYAVWGDGEITLHSFDYNRGDLISDCREVGLSEEVIEPFL